MRRAKSKKAVNVANITLTVTVSKFTSWLQGEKIRNYSRIDFWVKGAEGAPLTGAGRPLTTLRAVATAAASLPTHNRDILLEAADSHRLDVYERLLNRAGIMTNRFAMKEEDGTSDLLLIRRAEWDRLVGSLTGNV